MPIKILIADDHQMFREGLNSLLQGDPKMEVVGMAQNGREAVQLCSALLPDVVLMDISMPDLNGIEATRQIQKEHPEMMIIGLSMHADHRFVTRMLKAGAVGYLLKDSAFEELARAIRVVKSGKIYLSTNISDLLIKDYIRNIKDEETSYLAKLSEREREVLQLLAEGKNVKQIAAKLDISDKTVETHRQHIMRKLEIYNLADLIKFALREGITTLE